MAYIPHLQVAFLASATLYVVGTSDQLGSLVNVSMESSHTKSKQVLVREIKRERECVREALGY